MQANKSRAPPSPSTLFTYLPQPCSQMSSAPGQERHLGQSQPRFLRIFPGPPLDGSLFYHSEHPCPTHPIASLLALHGTHAPPLTTAFRWLLFPHLFLRWPPYTHIFYCFTVSHIKGCIDISAPH